MYTQGILIPCWSENYKKFEYKKQPVTEEEITKWQEQGYYLDNYTGNAYDNRQPMPEWIDQIGRFFSYLEDKTYTFYRMDSMEIMPPHVDHFNRYSELFCKDKSRIRRVVVFLEDWKPGHYFEINGKALVNWRQGQWVLWEPHVEHAASNIGVDPRYTLQITGHV